MYKNTHMRVVLFLFSIVLLLNGSVAAVQKKGASPVGGSPVAAVSRRLEVVSEAPILTKRFICFYEGALYVALEQYDPESDETYRTLMSLPQILQDELKEKVPAPEIKQVRKERQRYPVSAQEAWSELLEREFDSSWWSLVPECVLKRLGWERDSDFWI